MTIQEYSTLMGYEETCEMAEYETANFIYMMAGDMDKQTFCKEYKKAQDNELIRVLAQAAESRRIAYNDKEKKEIEIAHAIMHEANDLRETKDEKAEALDVIAARLIGRKDVIKWKIHKGYQLGDTDKHYIFHSIE